MLAAQIGEVLGQDVVSAASVNEALGLIKLAGLNPVLVVVDAGQQVNPGDVERLTEAKRETPLVLIASGLRRDTFDGLRERCAAYLVRPVSIGRIARAVKLVLEERARHRT
jgi:DNA-binding response OmpR family regulator